MYISRIFVRNFRNFPLLDVAVNPGVTCFIGENNTGKTNLVDAIRLVLDGTLSPSRRRLKAVDFSQGLSVPTPEHVLISVEVSDFTGKPSEEALVMDAVIAPDQARITYRFRPNSLIREAAQNDQPYTPPTLDDYRWEMVAGGDVDLTAIDWADDFGTYFHSDLLQQSYLVVLMGALRDVETSLANARSSPLQGLIEQSDIPAAEQQTLVDHLTNANAQINQSQTIGALGTRLTTSFENTVGATFGMSVKLGLSEASFADISKALRVLLSGYGVTDIDPARNGLGLNNILYITMLMASFEQRMAKGTSAGQLLLVEEPEAHLHPQLQRVLLATLKERNVQCFITTHSTHITSAVPLAAQVVFTAGGGAVTQTASPVLIPELDARGVADLERYLDATRSTLLFARAVILVEGPAEQFLIPPLVKRVLDIDLDQLGIAVIPIFGTHFGPYARLFGPNGIRKRCAVVTDGDLKPSDAGGEDDDPDLAGVTAEEPAVNALRNEYVEIFQSTTTFEPELTLPGNLTMLGRATGELGAPVVSRKLLRAAMQADPDLTALGQSVLNTAKRFGKARFAQVASRHITREAELPHYIQQAIMWIV